MVQPEALGVYDRNHGLRVQAVRAVRDIGRSLGTSLEGLGYQANNLHRGSNAERLMSATGWQLSSPEGEGPWMEDTRRAVQKRALHSAQERLPQGTADTSSADNTLQPEMRRRLREHDRWIRMVGGLLCGRRLAVERRR